jgi:uncharacterized membrane protein YdjX (TVP38/TMEM64 family)
VKFLLFVSFLAAGAGVFFWTPLHEMLTAERVEWLIAEWRGAWWSPLLLVALYVGLALLGLPTGPLLAGGAMFGFLHGSLYSLTGLLLGAAASYEAARFLGRDFVAQITGERLRRAERLLERHGFWPLVQTRFLPLPFSAVNFGAALAGVRPMRFLIASVVGLVPSTLIHTYFIARLISDRGGERVATLAWYAGAFVAFNVVISAVWLRGEEGLGRKLSGAAASSVRKARRRLGWSRRERE